jgi:hypothetical protein
MSKQNNKRCTIKTQRGEIVGTILKEYEEIGGPDDGAAFVIIQLDNQQLITVKMSEILDQ